jgi:hypothetical protein
MQNATAKTFGYQQQCSFATFCSYVVFRGLLPPGKLRRNIWLSQIKSIICTTKWNITYDCRARIIAKMTCFVLKDLI